MCYEGNILVSSTEQMQAVFSKENVTKTVFAAAVIYSVRLEQTPIYFTFS
jgi:hypothetical protein